MWEKLKMNLITFHPLSQPKYITEPLKCTKNIKNITATVES